MQLGELQAKVLAEIVNIMMKGEEEKHIVSSLARVLNTDHAVIFRCVQSLEEKALLESEQEVKKGKRFLVPTDFGAIIAFHECGVDYEKWVEKHGDSDARAELETLQGLVKNSNSRKVLYKSIQEFYLNNNLFSRGALTVHKSAYWNKLARLEIARTVAKLRKDDSNVVDEKAYQQLLKGLDVKLSQLVEIEG